MFVPLESLPRVCQILSVQSYLRLVSEQSKELGYVCILV